MTTAALPRRIMRPVASAPARRSFLIGFGATFVLGVVVMLGISFAVAAAAGQNVLPGVRVAGVDVAGLDRSAALDRLEASLPSLSTGTATVSIGATEYPVSYEELGRRHDLDAMVDAALAVGRSGNPVSDAVTRLRAVARPTELAVAVHAYDADRLRAAAIRIASAGSVPAVEATVRRDGTTFVATESATGQAVASTSIAAAIADAVDNARPADVTVTVAAEAVQPIVDTATAEAAAAAATAMARDLELSVPDAEDELKFDGATIAGWISFAPWRDPGYTARIDHAAVTSSVAALADEIDRDAVDAQFGVAGSGLGGVIAAVEGRELDVEASADAIVTALEERGGGDGPGTVPLVVDVTEPEFTTAEAEETLPQMQMVSSWTTHYVPGDGNGFGNNISIPAWDLDGYNLAPGEWFSFWDGIGPVTVERGYRYGGAIINGRSVAQGALAGGICSTSTTLFNAAMRFGLEIGERTAHYYYIDRYPTGLDATVAIVDDSVVDMTFRNDTDSPIVIRGFGSPGQVTFQLWSVPNGRTVALSPASTSNHRNAIETTQVDASLAPGTSRRVEYPHDGFDAVVSRTVYDADGSIVHQNTWYSSYRAVNGITLVGPKAAAAEPPADEPADGTVAGDPPAEGEEPPAAEG